MFTWNTYILVEYLPTLSNSWLKDPENKKARMMKLLFSVFACVAQLITFQFVILSCLHATALIWYYRECYPFLRFARRQRWYCSRTRSDVYITNVPAVAIFQRIYRCQDLDAAAYEIRRSIKGPSPIFRPFLLFILEGLFASLAWFSDDELIGAQALFILFQILRKNFKLSIS